MMLIKVDGEAGHPLLFCGSMSSLLLYLHQPIFDGIKYQAGTAFQL